MVAAGLDSDRPVDLFKIKAANRGDPIYEGPLYLLGAYFLVLKLA